MTRPVISATGLYTPPYSISNAELVASLNAWTDNWNAEHAAEISAGRLEAKRQDILQRAQQTLSEDMALDADDLPDEMDLASSEYLQSFTFRLRGREKMFLDKIGKALERIQEGTFGQCDECGEEISIKRLEARPETTLCIRCKEDQERVEKDFG